MWAPVARQLVAAGRHVWSFDFRGHGDSDAPDGDYSWHGFGDDALAVAEHLGVAGDPTLVACGHSKGGAALILGEQKRPGTYARIWAYEPIIFASEDPLPPQDDFFLARAARKRRNEWSSTDEAYAAYASKPPLDVLTEESLRAYVDYGLRDRGDGVFELKCAPDIEARVYTMGPNHGAYARLGTADQRGAGRVRRDVAVDRSDSSAPRSPNASRTARSRCCPGSATSARSRIPTRVSRRSSASPRNYRR